jgi:hypothetical protein
MQTPPLTASLVSTLSGTPSGTDQNGKSVRTASNQSLILPAVASAAAAADGDLAGAASEAVSLSANVQIEAARDLPAPVYAEIWKGAMKVAQVDIHGHVTSYSGLVPSGGGGVGGPLLAAQRAVQVAQSIGGEIRTAGQALDGNTLLMRARLASAYLG